MLNNELLSIINELPELFHSDPKINQEVNNVIDIIKKIANQGKSHTFYHGKINIDREIIKKILEDFLPGIYIKTMGANVPAGISLDIRW